MWRPDDAVGSLPGLVIVERGTALAVLTGRVVSADTPAVDLAGKETHLHHHIHMLLSICVCVCVWLKNNDERKVSKSYRRTTLWD